MARRPSVLDVVRAVTNVAPHHPEVTAWWYCPTPPFRVRGQLAPSADLPPGSLEVAVEVEGRSPDFDFLASRLASELWDVPVSVRLYRGAEEEKRLYRILSSAGPEAVQPMR